MTSLIYGQQAREDLDRLTDFLLETDPVEAASTTALISDALKILMRHPLIGRAADQWNRELVISRGRTGYVALYSYDEDHDVVLVQAIRHQREAGFEE